MPADILVNNLLSPIVLAFVLGVLAQLVRSELEFPEPVLRLISIFLLLSIGLQGGRELAHTTWAEVSRAIGVTFLLVLLLPAHAYLVARRLGGFDRHNATGLAALYGSVSSVTFLAALSFAKALGTPAEGFMTGLVALMEWGIIIALLIGRYTTGRAEMGQSDFRDLFLSTLRSRGIVLLGGGMAMGMLTTDTGYAQIQPFFEGLFRGFLVLFLLEMGMTAARQLREFARVGWVMLAFAILVPLVHGAIGTLLGTLAGLSLGGAFVLGAVAASASYIDAPAAVRASFPKANPSIYLTGSLGLTFPFNLLLGLPIYYEMAKLWQAWLG
ncbi:sodium-dependent bicarbonate transport family permease [Aerophototrophica crusticola]|uniref:Sodium-dependent bicarbonate transport family permease n=1 Tax=Aerophototrophica crusticola TaxID=1709002 RepID=A0A858R305_9PROT|nr:sodium-dependent bicarbonate transport family permease [Rhodospirillaceae bacterium B3]